MDLFKIFATLGLRGQAEFNKGLQDAEGQGRKTSTALDSAFKRIGTAVAAAFSVHAIVAFTQKMVEASATISARNAQFQATFKEVGAAANEMFSRVSRSTSIMSERLQNVGTKAFSQLKGAGLEANEALAETERYLNLAADAAAYYDISLEDADMRLRSFIRGNVEAGDMIGLFTSEAQRNAAAMEAYGKAYIACTEAQKQMIMLDIADEIYEQSGAIGQAQREGDAWENTIGNLKESWTQFLAELGKPVMERMIPIAQWLTGALASMRGESGDLGAALGNLRSATDEYKTAQEQAVGSTDALTLAMVQQRKEVQRNAFVDFAEGISQANEELLTYRENLQSTGTALKTALDISRRRGAQKQLLAEFGIDIDTQSADDVAMLYSRLDEFRDLYESGNGSRQGRTYLKELIEDLEGAEDAVDEYRVALETLTNETERTMLNQEAALKGYADLVLEGNVSYTDLIGHVDQELISLFKSVEDGISRGMDKAEEFVATIPKEAEAYNQVFDDYLQHLQDIESEQGYMNDAYWGDYAVLKAIQDAAEELGITLESINKIDIIEDDGNGSDPIVDRFKATASAVAGIFQEVTSYANSFFSALADMSSQSMQRQMAAIDAELEALEEKYEKERDMAEDAYDRESEDLLAHLAHGDLTQQQYIERKKALDDSYEDSKQASLDEEAAAEEELTRKKDELARKMFDAQKAQQISQVWIQAATAIMTSMAQLGWPWGLAAIPVITATAGVQSKNIADQEYTPLLAEGGIIDRPTRVIAGEDGPEAIVPLRNNTEWTNAVADALRPELSMSGAGGSQLIDEVRSMRRMLDSMLDRLLRKESAIVLDSGALVGSTAALMDRKLGTMQQRRMRR